MEDGRKIWGQNLVDLIVEETHTCYRGERSENMIGVMDVIIVQHVS